MKAEFLKKILVTGATGFIGKRLVRTLSAHNYQVVTLVRQFNAELATVPNVTQLLLPAAVESIESILDNDIDAICHAAAFQTRAALNHAQLRTYLESNVLLTDDLLRASSSLGIKRFIYFSAGNAYAQTTAMPAAETDALYPSLSSPYYLGTKVLAEFFVEHYQQRLGLDAIILRIAAVYGSGMPHGSALTNFIERARQGLALEIQGDGSYAADFVYVQDVADVTLAALESGSPGIYNIGTGAATPLREVAHQVQQVFHSNAPIEFVSAPAGASKGFRPLNCDKARQTWQWTPKTLCEGLTLMRNELEQRTH